jgi:hypothetical protein
MNFMEEYKKRETLISLHTCVSCFLIISIHILKDDGFIVTLVRKKI